MLGGLVVLVVVAYLAIAPTGPLPRPRGVGGGSNPRSAPLDRATSSRIPRRTPPIAAKLRLVLAARAFAADSIGLRAKQSFTTYSHLDRDTLVLVLSGAYRDRLAPYTWWFPIVGRVPYKGFFDFAAARAGGATSSTPTGFDVYLRPSPAFSTLGWFNDPLLSTSLRADSLDLANTVIHELTHNTFYAPGQAVFNESFANFVGARGSAWFFRSRGAPAAADQADARWADEKLLARFWAQALRDASTRRSRRIRRTRWRVSRRETRSTRARGASSSTGSARSFARSVRARSSAFGSTTRRSSRTGSTTRISICSTASGGRSRAICGARSRGSSIWRRAGRKIRLGPLRNGSSGLLYEGSRSQADWWLDGAPRSRAACADAPGMDRHVDSCPYPSGRREATMK